MTVQDVQRNVNDAFCDSGSSPPARLRACHNWVAARGKQPFVVMPDGSLDPNDWNNAARLVDYDTAYAASGDGVGFITGHDSGILIADFEKMCYDPSTGWIEPAVKKIVDALDSYTTVSTSGFGLHVWVEATLPAMISKTRVPGGTTEVELFPNNKHVRYGKVLFDRPIRACQPEIDALAAQLRPVISAETSDTTATEIVPSDIPATFLDDLIETWGIRGRELVTLIIDGGEDRSKTDFTICLFMLRLYGGGREHEVAGILASLLVHPTWASGAKGHERGAAYVETTINHALSEYDREMNIIADGMFRDIKGKVRADEAANIFAYRGGICYVGERDQDMPYLFSRTSGLYEKDSFYALEQRIERLLKMSNLEEREKVVSTLAKHPGVLHRLVAMNEPAPEIVVGNGILNVTTRDLRPFDPHTVAFTGVPIHYDPKPSAEALARLDAFIERVIPDPKEQAVLWQVIGYMLADFTAPLLFYIVGAAGSGKSQVLSLIRTCYGTKNFASATPQSLAAKFGASGLIGKLGNIAEEGGGVLPDDYRILLDIATGGEVRTEAKYKAEQYVRLHTPLLFASNDPPRMASGGAAAEALGDRLVIIHSGKPVRGTDDDEPDYGLHLGSDPAIRTAFLHRALAGLDDLREKKKFSRTTKMMETVAEVVTSGDPIRDFIEDTDWIEVTDHEDQELKQDVYLIFKEWMRDTGLRVSKDIRYDDFNRGIHSLIRANVLRGVHDAQPRVAGERPRVWVGLKIIKTVAQAVAERDARERVPFRLT